jgi:hypothetical protein
MYDGGRVAENKTTEGLRKVDKRGSGERRIPGTGTGSPE